MGNSHRIAAGMFVFAGLALLACGSSSSDSSESIANEDAAGDSAVSDDDAAIGSSKDSGACTDSPANIVEMSALFTSDAGTAYKVDYLVNGEHRLGQLCVPSSAGPHPVIALNHGGFAGLTDELTTRPQCSWAMGNGWIGVEAQYRGQSDPGFGKSGGSIELCKGEVTDIRELLHIAKNRCDADPSRVLAMGGSHGGCNTLQMLVQQEPLRAALDVVGPTDMKALYEFHDSNRTTGDATEQAIHNGLADDFKLWIGGTPAEVPDEYTARSPLFFAAAFPTVPLLIIHGTADYFVPHKHSCLLRDALVSAGATFTNIHIENTSGMGNVITDQVPTCTTATYAPTWPTTFSGDHYLIILDGQGHGFVGAGAARAAEAGNKFLLEHVK